MQLRPVGPQCVRKNTVFEPLSLHFSPAPLLSKPTVWESLCPRFACEWYNLEQSLRPQSTSEHYYNASKECSIYSGCPNLKDHRNTLEIRQGLFDSPCGHRIFGHIHDYGYKELNDAL